MTRRITIAILLTVSVILIGTALITYAAVRQVLLADLDTALIARASALPQQIGEQTMQPVDAQHPGDRYVVRSTQTGQTLARQAGDGVSSPPIVLHAGFATLPNQTRVRTLSVQMLARPGGATSQPAQQVTIAVSGSAAEFDRQLDRLAMALLISGVAGGVLAALIAHRVARRTLRPLNQTAADIGSIDDRSLDRRIEVARLPDELRPVAVRLNEMLARLQLAAQQREQFLVDVSHELRTPVAALRTAMEVSLRRPRDADYYREVVETSLADAQLLARMVDLLLTQVRGRQTPATIEPVELEPLLRQCVRGLEPLARERGVTLETSARRGLLVRGDITRVQSVLLNLIGNAIEYHRPAGGKVSCGAELHGSTARITIADDGPGIASEHIPRLFEAFYRVDPARTSGHLGLGLSLVKNYVESMQGTVKVISQQGVGTTFVIELLSEVIPPDADDMIQQKQAAGLV